MEKFNSFEEGQDKTSGDVEKEFGDKKEVDEESIDSEESGNESEEKTESEGEKEKKSENKESLGFSKKMRQMAALAILPFFLVGKEPVFATEKAETKDDAPIKTEHVLSEKTKTLSEKISFAGFPEKEREGWKEKIGFELEVLSSIGDDIKKQVELSGHKLPGVNFEDMAVEKILEMEDLNSRLSDFSNPQKEIEKFQEKRFENGVLNIDNFKEAFGLFGAKKLFSLISVAIHEEGHVLSSREEGREGKIEYIKLKPNNLFRVLSSDSAGRMTWVDSSDNYSRKVESGEAKRSNLNINRAGINTNKKAGELIIEFLRSEQDVSSEDRISPFARQMLAIFAMESRMSGFRYAYGTLLSKGVLDKEKEAKKEIGRNPEKYKNEYYRLEQFSMNDLLRYSVNTGVPIEELCLGLMADFVFDPDVYKAIPIALGEQGVKFSDTTLKLSYDLMEEGPQWGVNFDTRF